MDLERQINELRRNKDIFTNLLGDLKDGEYLWKPKPEKWCLLEILCHLCDEEREDFRARTKHVLETPDLPLPGIDPVGWVTERSYIEQDYTGKLKEFTEERERSIKWLGTLSDPGWENAHEHPKFGPMTAGMFLVNWVAHDYFHIRQIINLKYAFLDKMSDESLGYAGNW